MKKFYVLLAIVALSVAASAGTIPGGWSCQGNCGTGGPDGVVPLGPSGNQYEWVSTNLGVGALGLGLGSETDGSLLKSSTFSAVAGDPLHFYFNFVTSDGSGFADYAWVKLVDANTLSSILLFTARTTPSGNTVPGFGMPPIDPGVTLNPGFVTVVPGAPVWSPLGSWGNGNYCYTGPGKGCGYTGWVESSYNILANGSYYLEFGTVNWLDQIYDTGLAIDNVTVNNVPIPGQVPEPGSLVLLGSGLIGVAGAIRRRLM